MVHLALKPESWLQVGLSVALDVLQHRQANRRLMAMTVRHTAACDLLSDPPGGSARAASTRDDWVGADHRTAH